MPGHRAAARLSRPRPQSRVAPLCPGRVVMGGALSRLHTGVMCRCYLMSQRATYYTVVRRSPPYASVSSPGLLSGTESVGPAVIPGDGVSLSRHIERMGDATTQRVRSHLHWQWSSGTTAAIQAAKLGKKTAVIKSQCIGGACVETGTIPSKTFREAVRRLYPQPQFDGVIPMSSHAYASHYAAADQPRRTRDTTRNAHHQRCSRTE